MLPLQVLETCMDIYSYEPWQYSSFIAITKKGIFSLQFLLVQFIEYQRRKILDSLTPMN